MLSGASMYAAGRATSDARAWSRPGRRSSFIVFPWHLARAEHASLVHLEVLALLVLALVAAAATTLVAAVRVSSASPTLACWLTSGYFGAMAVVTVIAFGVGAGLTLRPPPRPAARLRLDGSRRRCDGNASRSRPSPREPARDAGLDRRVRRPVDLGLRPLRARRPVREPRARPSLDGFFLGAAGTASNLTESSELPRAADDRARDRLARVRVCGVGDARQRRRAPQRPVSWSPSWSASRLPLPSPIRVLGQDLF